MKIKTDAEADVNITSLIDCLMQCIIFFMVIMSANYVYGVAIKFAPAGQSKGKVEQPKEKHIVVYVQSDQLDRAPDGGQRVVREGILKLNDEEMMLSDPTTDPETWDDQRKKAYDYLGYKMKELIKQGYKNDVLMVQGDMKSYHGKVMAVIDQGKADSIDGFSLIPPQK
jgi:biopolymer transport protein ExbD